MQTIRWAVTLAIIFTGSHSMAGDTCTGTFYAVEGPSNAPIGYSLWTFSKDGSVISSSSSEPSVPFSTAQGNWEIYGRQFIKSKTFDFSGPNPNLNYPNVARIDASFKFHNNCSRTVAGQSKFSVTSCPVSEGPNCAFGTVISKDVAIELTRISF